MAVVEFGGQIENGDLEQKKIDGREESIKDGMANIDYLRSQEAYYRRQLDELHESERIAKENLGGILDQISAIEHYIGLVEPVNGSEGNGKVNGVPRLEPLP